MASEGRGNSANKKRSRVVQNPNRVQAAHTKVNRLPNCLPVKKVLYCFAVAFAHTSVLVSGAAIGYVWGHVCMRNAHA